MFKHKLLTRFLFAADGDGGPAPEVEEHEDEKPEDEGTGDDQEKNEKTFTQAQVNEVLKGRLAQKDAKHRRDLEAAKAAQDSAEAEAAQYKQVFETHLAERIAPLDEATQALVRKLTPADQIAWLTENPLDTLLKKTAPATPKPRDERNPQKPKRLRTGI